MPREYLANLSQDLSTTSMFETRPLLLTMNLSTTWPSSFISEAGNSGTYFISIVGVWSASRMMAGSRSMILLSFSAKIDDEHTSESRIVAKTFMLVFSFLDVFEERYVIHFD